MLQRIKQFYNGMMAKGPDKQETELINSVLPQPAICAFYGMTIADQRHCLNVMHTAMDICDSNNYHIDRLLLQRCTLLHDIGRGKFMGVWTKTFAVLLNHYLTGFAHRLGEFNGEKETELDIERLTDIGNGGNLSNLDNLSVIKDLGSSSNIFCQIMFRYYHHAEISAAMLSQINMSAEACIVGKHHSPDFYGMPMELIILKQADGLN